MSLKTINELTEVDESQLQNDALLEGAIPPVSGSIFTPVKVTLAKLAKWILNSYTGLSLAGSSQSVKSAVDSLSGTVTTLNNMVAMEVINDKVTLTDTTYIDQSKCVLRFYKVGNIRVLAMSLWIIQTPTSPTQIGTIESGHIPPSNMTTTFSQINVTNTDSRSVQVLADGRIRLSRGFATTSKESEYYSGVITYAV